MQVQGRKGEPVPDPHELREIVEGRQALDTVEHGRVGDRRGAAGRPGLDMKTRLDDNDAHTVLEALGDPVATGPTLTNVNDLGAVLVLPPS